MTRTIKLMLAAIICAGWVHGDPTSIFNITQNLDGYFASSGPYQTFQNMFNLSSGYTESTSGFVNVFPNQTTIAWSVPATPCPSVCGFLQQSYGNYSGGSARGVTQKQVSAINTLTENLNLSFAGSANGYDSIDDLFLCPTSSPCTNVTATVEISPFFHTPASACFGYSALGTNPHTISGVSWNFTKSSGSPAQICMIPASGSDITSIALDLLGTINYLAGVSGSTVTTSLYYQGHALGVEPLAGSGSIVINSRNITYN